MRSIFMRAIGLTLLLGAMFTGSAAAQSWKAGAAKINITPDHSMWMSGYAARDKPAQGKMTELWAKALALEDSAGKRAVLITLDVVGIDRGLSVSVCDKLQKKHGLDRSQIAINCSHTHGGPVVNRNLRPMHEYSLDKQQQELIHQYADKLERSIQQVAEEALGKLDPASLAWSSGRTYFAL